MVESASKYLRTFSFNEAEYEGMLLSFNFYNTRKGDDRVFVETRI